MFNGIFKLANVSRPVIKHECSHCLLSDAYDLSPGQVIEMLYEMIHQEGVYPLFARKGLAGDNFYDIDPKIKVFPELTFLNQVFHVSMGCRNYPGICLNPFC